jgi:hypothetical protein
MQTRTNSAPALATLLMVGWLGRPPAPANDSRHLKWADTTFQNEKESLTGEYGMNWKARRSEVLTVWEQYLPKLPPGASIRSAPTPAAMQQPLVFRMPVRTQPPLPRRPVDQAKVERITGQLESLLKAVQPEVSEASKGQLPRDLIPNLKRIEKLSKQLRHEISP